MISCQIFFKTLTLMCISKSLSIHLTERNIVFNESRIQAASRFYAHNEQETRKHKPTLHGSQYICLKSFFDLPKLRTSYSTRKRVPSLLFIKVHTAAIQMQSFQNLHKQLMWKRMNKYGLAFRHGCSIEYILC